MDTYKGNRRGIGFSLRSNNFLTVDVTDIFFPVHVLTYRPEER